MSDLPPGGREDPTEVVRVTTTGVRGRPGRRVPGGRGPVLVSVALVTALVLAGLALRNAPTKTDQSTPRLNGAGAVSATDDDTIGPTPIEPSTTEPEATPYQSVDSTAVQTPELAPSAEATASPTKKPPRQTAAPDPGPTDAPHPTWTPPPVFTGTATMYDRCFAPNGKEQVMVNGEWSSPVAITAVMFFLDGSPFGSHYIKSGSFEAGVASGNEVDVGTSHVGMVKFYSGPSGSDLVATRESDPFIAPQGPPCPTG